MLLSGMPRWADSSGALPWLWETKDASPPPEEVRSSLERMYQANAVAHGPGYLFLVAADSDAKVCH